MRVRRIIGWARPSDQGGFVEAGSVVEMDDELARLHIRCGDAAAVTDAAPPSASAAPSGETVHDVIQGFRSKAEIVAFAKERGIEIGEGKLADMKAELELQLENAAPPPGDASTTPSGEV